MKEELPEKKLARKQRQVQTLEKMIEDTTRNLYLSREQYREQSDFLGNVLESLTYPFFVVDATDYTVKMANAAAWQGALPQNITCYEMSHGQKQPCGDPENPCPLEAVKKSKEPTMVKHVHFDEKNRARHYEVYGFPIFDGGGTVVQMIEYQLDVTKRQAAEEKSEHQLQRLSALRDIDVAITASFDLRLVLGVVLEKAQNLLGVDAVDLLLYRPNLQILEYEAGRGFRTNALKYTRLKIGESHAGQAALDRHTVHVPDLRKQNGFTRSEQLAAENFVSYFGVPLIAKGSVKGVLEVFSRDAVGPDGEWLDFLNALGGQAAIAVDNATMLEGLNRANTEMIMAYDETIEGWSRALDLRDKETEGHSRRVTELTLLTARAMGVAEAEQAHMRRGALLHDIGKMGIPDSILFKPGSLGKKELELMRKHSMLGFKLLSPISFLGPALDIPYCHHEKWDGSGYPRGLKGRQIPLAARIFTIVDIYDALCSKRPYRQALSREEALEHIHAISGKELDPKAVEVFMETEKEFLLRQVRP